MTVLGSRCIFPQSTVSIDFPLEISVGSVGISLSHIEAIGDYPRSNEEPSSSLEYQCS